MPLNIPSWILEALLQKYSADPLLLLFTFFNAQIGEIRLVRNTVNITSRGGLFTAAPISCALATDDENLPVVEIRIPNVDRAIGRALAVARPPLHVSIEAVMASDPDVVFRRYSLFEMDNVTWDAIAITGSLSQSRLTNEPHPNIRITPHRFPAFFR